MLDLSQPTVRAWIDAAILEPIAGTTPVRIDVLSLADVKRALDLIRRDGNDRQLLAQVMRLLRDREAVAGSEEGFADVRAGRVTKPDSARPEELLPDDEVSAQAIVHAVDRVARRRGRRVR